MVWYGMVWYGMIILCYSYTHEWNGYNMSGYDETRWISITSKVIIICVCINTRTKCKKNKIIPSKLCVLVPLLLPTTHSKQYVQDTCGERMK